MPKFNFLLMAIFSHALFLFGGINSNAQNSLDVGLEELATKLSEVVGNEGIERLAVLQFDCQGNKYQELAEYIAEELSVSLTNNEQGIEVYDRHHLSKVLGEHKLNLSGLIDESTTKQVGEFSGADALVVGQFSVIGDVLKLWVKVLDTGTAKQIAAESSSIVLDEATESLIMELSTEFHAPNSNLEEESSSGAFCFEHNQIGARTCFVKLIYKTNQSEIQSLTVSPNASVCAYDLNPGTYIVKVIDTYGNVIQNYQVKINPGKEIHKKMKG